jgi:hypothetical protein
VNSDSAGTLTGVAGLARLIPASCGLLLTGVPTILYPLPLLTIISAFLLSTWRLHYLPISRPVLLFLLWHPGLFRGAPQVQAIMHSPGDCHRAQHCLLHLRVAIGPAISGSCIHSCCGHRECGMGRGSCLRIRVDLEEANIV